MKNRGFGRKGLKLWGVMFLSAWVLARIITQGLLEGAEGEEILTVLNQGTDRVWLAGLALILEAVGCCGILVYGAMTLEGVRHTQNPKAYLGRVGMLALACEIPYDLLMTGKFFDLRAQNPVFGVFICIFMMIYWNLYSKRNGKFLIRLLLMLAAMVWCGILRVEYGLPLLLTVLILSLFPGKTGKWGLAGFLAGASCILLSPFFLAAPMGAIVLHFYNGESREEENRRSYLPLPLMLICGALVTML